MYQHDRDTGSRLRCAALAVIMGLGLALPGAAQAQQGNYSTAYQGSAYSNTAPSQPTYETRNYSYDESQPRLARAQTCADAQGRSQGGCTMMEQKAKAANYLLAPFPREQCENFINNGKLRSYNACQQ